MNLCLITFLLQIACLRAALARKDGDHESIRSTQSSPDIYRMIMGNASPASRHPIEDGSIEVFLSFLAKIYDMVFSLITI